MAESESGKKHLLIEVPDHVSQSGDEDRKMTTFLRMGTFDPDAPGMDLLSDFEEFYDDTRDRGQNEVGPPVGSPGHTLTVAERQAETARLFTRGGWQDHSDGNRLTTTRGDKVEIIRGNYKMLVLGRQDEFDDGAGWDISGGKIEDDDFYPPAYCEWKWVQTWGGTWKLVQVEEKTDVHEIVHGNLKEEFYGDSMESIVGAESDAVDVDHASDDAPRDKPEKSKKKRPDIVEKTWAKSITSSTGSALAPVPTILETTFALAITEATNATAITETVTSGALSSVTAVSGAIIETVTAGTISESTTASSLTSTTTIATITETTTATTVNETFRSGAASETVAVGASTSQEFYGVRNELTTAGARSAVDLVAADFSFKLAAVMLDIELSALRGEIKAGLGFFEIEAAIIYVELFIGIKMEIKLGGEIKYDTTSKEFSLEKTVGIGL